MLTKSDLSQITTIVKTVVRFENQSVENKIDTLEKKIDKRFDKLDRKLDYSINFLDRDYIKLLHRVERIEEHLNLEATSI